MQAKANPIRKATETCRDNEVTVPDTPKFPFNARIRLYWPLVRSHSICSHSLSGECELMRYIWPKANARIRGHSCAHSHLGISHSHNSINYPIQMRALASRCYAHCWLQQKEKDTRFRDVTIDRTWIVTSLHYSMIRRWFASCVARTRTWVGAVTQDIPYIRHEKNDIYSDHMCL